MFYLDITKWFDLIQKPKDMQPGRWRLSLPSVLVSTEKMTSASENNTEKGRYTINHNIQKGVLNITIKKFTVSQYKTEENTSDHFHL